MAMAQTTIVFLKVRDNPSKVDRICKTLQQHFEQGCSILVTVPTKEAAEYLDQMLWRVPAESFLPHFRSEESSNDLVVITTTQANVNKATLLFNLCPEASPICKEFTQVYELLDETDPAKLKSSLNRKAAYAAAGYTIKEIDVYSSQ